MMSNTLDVLHEAWNHCCPLSMSSFVFTLSCTTLDHYYLDERGIGSVVSPCYTSTSGCLLNQHKWTKPNRRGSDSKHDHKVWPPSGYQTGNQQKDQKEEGVVKQDEHLFKRMHGPPPIPYPVDSQTLARRRSGQYEPWELMHIYREQGPSTTETFLDILASTLSVPPPQRQVDQKIITYNKVSVQQNNIHNNIQNNFNFNAGGLHVHMERPQFQLNMNMHRQRPADTMSVGSSRGIDIYSMPSCRGPQPLRQPSLTKAQMLELAGVEPPHGTISDWSKSKSLTSSTPRHRAPSETTSITSAAALAQKDRSTGDSYTWHAPQRPKLHSTSLHQTCSKDTWTTKTRERQPIPGPSWWTPGTPWNPPARTHRPPSTSTTSTPTYMSLKKLPSDTFGRPIASQENKNKTPPRTPSIASRVPLRITPSRSPSSSTSWSSWLTPVQRKGLPYIIDINQGSCPK